MAVILPLQCGASGEIASNSFAGALGGEPPFICRSDLSQRIRCIG
jgi:hypothetical protein